VCWSSDSVVAGAKHGGRQTGPGRRQPKCGDHQLPHTMDTNTYRLRAVAPELGIKGGMEPVRVPCGWFRVAWVPVAWVPCGLGPVAWVPCGLGSSHAISREWVPQRLNGCHMRLRFHMRLGSTEGYGCHRGIKARDGKRR
jgi:hypothetical protein